MFLINSLSSLSEQGVGEGESTLSLKKPDKKTASVYAFNVILVLSFKMQQGVSTAFHTTHFLSCFPE